MLQHPLSWLPALVCLLCFTSNLPAQNGEAEQKKQLAQQVKQMQSKLESIHRTWNRKSDRHGTQYLVSGKQVWSDYADLAVYLKAAEWTLKHEEFDKRVNLQHVEQTLKDVDELLREMQNQGTRSYRVGSQICGYVSEVDQSVQPYAVSLPEGFPLDGSRAQRYPLYVVLHGRGGMNEVNFITKHRQKEPREGQEWIQIDVFGRVDNAFRWAGETDIFEAIKDVSRRFPIDDNRITLWGFSMGGAGAWQMGVHHPSLWASAGAGAGFVDYYRYLNKKDQLPDYQHKTLRIYDSADYALNLANVDFVTYGGDQDKQIQASEIMVAEAKKQDIDVKFIIGKDIGHKFTPEGEAEFQAFLAEHNQAGRPAYPGPTSLRFVTYTPKYNVCYWLQIEELEEMYEKTTVESELDESTGVLKLETQNVALLKLSRDIADQVSLDGEPPLALREAADNLLPEVYYEKRDAGWELLSYDDSRDYQENGNGHKRKDLQGPIDDAFMQSFLCVRGTGKPWSAEHEAWAKFTLNRFEKEFDKWMRGEIRIVDDKDVTPEMIRQHHLILFGDPGSNRLIQQTLKELPITWLPKNFEVQGKTWDTNSHGLAMIYPNPLNPHKYIVLNSGMTTHEADFKGTNALLFPKLGDIAVLKFEKQGKNFQETTLWADLFNSHWELP